MSRQKYLESHTVVINTSADERVEDGTNNALEEEPGVERPGTERSGEEDGPITAPPPANTTASTETGIVRTKGMFSVPALAQLIPI